MSPSCPSVPAAFASAVRRLRSDPRPGRPGPPSLRVVRRVVQFIERAADDPQVLAIKQTLYRTSGGSPIIRALERAAQNGKQVTALVELKARLDEENNIVWARSLEKAGVHVVYGMVGLKTHCKAALVVRREPDGTPPLCPPRHRQLQPDHRPDLHRPGLFTARPEFGEDASELFNLLTGYSQGRRWRKFLVAPLGLREQVIELIDREGRNAEPGQPARIIVKMNALVEPTVIEALYRAAQAGVRIDLDRTRHLLPPRRTSPGSPRTSGSSASSTSSWSTAASSTSRTPETPRSSSAAPTGCPGISTAGSS